MQKVLTAEEMREVDRLTTEKYGIPSILLMENAAHATANIIKEKLGGSVKGKSIVVLCGKGNNGGDGAALARILWSQGAYVVVYLFGKVKDTKGDAKTNFEIIENLDDAESVWIIEGDTKDFKIVKKDREDFPNQGGDLFLIQIDSDEYPVSSLNFDFNEFDIFVDALFGTGLDRKLDYFYTKKIISLRRFYNIQVDNKRFQSLFVSLDIPSGLFSDKSEYQRDSNMRADLTVTFTSPKLANVLPPASNFNGELHIANIGSPQELIDNCASQTFLAEKEDTKNWLFRTRFSKDSYKNKRGNALLIIGSRNYAGAAVLAGNAAMQSGVGLVTIATSESAQKSVSSRVLPEVMTQGVAETVKGAMSEQAFEKIKQLSKKADVLAIGSGLGSDEETTQKLVKEIVEKRTTPIVIDADGLNSLSPFNLHGSEEFPLILTPHEGEFLRLLGTSDKEAIKDRVGAVREFAQKHRVILVLKGERTLIAEPHGKVVINPTGNSGLGKAGNGDNLTGIITGFIAQAVQSKVDIFETVVAAVYIAGLAGDIAEKKFGKRTMLASDVRECLGDAFREVEGEFKI